MIRRLFTLFAFACTAALASSASAHDSHRGDRGHRGKSAHRSSKVHEASQSYRSSGERCHYPLADAYGPDRSRRSQHSPSDARWRGQRVRPELVALRDADRNGDGLVTLKEALRASQRSFRHADRNRNGMLSQREIARYAPAFAEDLNRDGWVSFRESRRQAKRSFHRLDRNGDRVLSRWELKQNRKFSKQRRTRPTVYASSWF